MPVLFRTRIKWPWALGMTMVALAISYPWRVAKDDIDLRIALLPIMASIRIPMLPRVLRKHAYALLIAIAVFLTIPLFDSATGWYTMGFEYGTQKFQTMMTGSGSWNIPAMLVKYFGWSRTQPEEPVYLPYFDTTVPIRVFLRGVYLVCIVLCGIGAAIQSARKDTRFLAAVTAPWLLFFLVLTQMHGRYSIWAAGISALLAGVSTGMALLGVVVTIVATLGIMQNQYRSAPDFDPWLLSVLRHADPGIGWIFILAALCYLFVALSPRNRMRGY
jgi:hypothetical protein